MNTTPTFNPINNDITVLENESYILFDTDPTNNTIYIYDKENNTFFNDIRWSDYTANAELITDANITSDQLERFIKRLIILSSAIKALINQFVTEKYDVLYFKPEGNNTTIPPYNEYRIIPSTSNGIIDITIVNVYTTNMYKHIPYNQTLDETIQRFLSEVRTTINSWIK